MSKSLEGIISHLVHRLIIRGDIVSVYVTDYKLTNRYIYLIHYCLTCTEAMEESVQVSARRSGRADWCAPAQ